MNVICSCGICNLPILEGDKMSDHAVFDFEGDLDYIELAHLGCAVSDNGQREANYWNVSL
jgi:hypothetical protein